MDEGAPFGFIGIGFGPSNLALAVAARERGWKGRVLFLERNIEFQWHPGMMIDGTRMQISFLKDLATLRNPASPYTFLQYLRSRGRLEHFVNLAEFRPTRREFFDYLSWVAEDFAESVMYNTDVARVRPIPGPKGTSRSLFQVIAQRSGEPKPSVLLAWNVVYAPGGRPRIPAGCTSQSPTVVHSSDFLLRFPDLFKDQGRPYVFVIAGDGQSAGEIVEYLLARYEDAHIHLLLSGDALRPADSTPFVNEQFYSHSAKMFYGYEEARRTELLNELRNSNYGGIEYDLLDRLYRIQYMDEVKGNRRLILHRHSRLAGVEDHDPKVCAMVADRFTGARDALLCDGVVLATGYDRTLDTTIFEDVLPYIEKDCSGQIILSQEYRVRAKPELQCGLYLQGLGESSFGIGDTLLSLLPFRSQTILEDILVKTPVPSTPLATYPPKHHVEDDPEKLYAVMNHFRFATMISVCSSGDPVVTQLPLTLDRSRGTHGVLFGHVDRANPHAGLLDGRDVLVLFHGPSAYISPYVYETDQLPTWNSITVQVRGRASLPHDQQIVRHGLCGVAQRSEEQQGRNVLQPDDPRIDALIDFIVGFEITIHDMVGRFKLSQDRADSDRRLAAIALARRTETGARDLISFLTGFSLPPEERIASMRPAL